VNFQLLRPRGALTVSRSWAPGAALESGGRLQVSGVRRSWDELRWERPVEQFRPILSYNELGTMFSSRAGALYEALSAVLGLEDFDAVLATLRQERLAREKTSKEEKQVRTNAIPRLQAAEDPRNSCRWAAAVRPCDERVSQSSARKRELAPNGAGGVVWGWPVWLAQQPGQATDVAPKVRR